MPTRRFVPNRFSRLLLLGAAAFLCTELTRKCSKVAPVYWPLMAILILLSLALLLYFAVSAVLFLYDHYFRRERTRWLLIVLVVLGLLLYGALTARILEAELAGTPASSSSWHVALRNYLDVVTGSDDRDSSPTVAREDPNAYVQPDNFFDGMGWVAAALVYALVCNLFYRKYRDYLILNRGYDTDNTLDGVCAVLLLIGGIAGFLWPLAWVAAGLLFALLLCRRAKRLGLHSLSITLIQPFAMLDSCFHLMTRSFAPMAAANRFRPPGDGPRITGDNAVIQEEASAEHTDLFHRQQLMRTYERRQQEKKESASK